MPRRPPDDCPGLEEVLRIDRMERAWLRRAHLFLREFEGLSRAHYCFLIRTPYASALPYKRPKRFITIEEACRLFVGGEQLHASQQLSLPDGEPVDLMAARRQVKLKGA